MLGFHHLGHHTFSCHHQLPPVSLRAPSFQAKLWVRVSFWRSMRQIASLSSRATDSRPMCQGPPSLQSRKPILRQRVPRSRRWPKLHLWVPTCRCWDTEAWGHVQWFANTDSMLGLDNIGILVTGSRTGLRPWRQPRAARDGIARIMRPSIPRMPSWSLWRSMCQSIGDKES